jgi:hypothetical protein
MVRFQKLIKMHFSSYTGTAYTVSSGNCPNFSCATSSSLLMLTAGPRDQFTRWRRSRRRLSLCSVLGVQICDYSAEWVSYTVEKRTFLCVASFFKPCTKLTLHCNHRSGHPKTEHAESLLLLPRHLGNWSRVAAAPTVSMSS